MTKKNPITLAYPKPSKKRVSQHTKAKLGLIQAVIPEEKKKAYKRDMKCILSWCSEFEFSRLDFHHVYWHNSEQKRGDQERNLAHNGVMLCRKHHDEVPKNKGIDLYCRQYLNRIYC